MYIFRGCFLSLKDNSYFCSKLGRMMYGIDIKEDELLAMGGGILDMLLIDRTTGENIIWATDDYAALGDSYTFHEHITPELITGENNNVIQPRVIKTWKEQVGRTKRMAEVFTPSWVCNSMANLLDKAWFGREEVFNVEDPIHHTWTPTTGPIQFPNGKTWQDYVRANYLEFTCGEAPFLTSRYYTTTGNPIPLECRIGIVDRKMRIVCENTNDDEEWLLWTQAAFKAIYGYEWQGDNLLLARESMLATFVDYYQARFEVFPPLETLHFMAYIISWNLWQMDGLKNVIPGSCHEETIVKAGLFEDEVEHRPCEGCAKKDVNKHNGIYSIIRSWTPSGKINCDDGETGRFVDIISMQK